MIFKYLAKLKNYGQRTLTYLTFVNGLMILLTFLEVKNIKIPFYIIIMLGIIIIIIIGILDYNFIMKYEYEHLNKRNDLKQDLELIKLKLGITRERVK